MGEIENLKSDGAKLTGDVMLAAAFVSYVGSFGSAMRTQLWKDNWKEDLKSRGVPISEDAAPLQQLTSEANNAKMMSEGLPSDSISIENGSITVNCARWPLIIDPQLQAIKWLRKKCEPVIDEETGEPIGRSLTVLQLSAKRWLNSLEHAITNGGQVIIENLGEQIDATLDPVLARAFYKKGRSLMLQLGGEEVEYDRNFQLYLQTKLPNPHYKPEIAAQCTLINFTSTELGLEDQLLAKVVNAEKPELEEKKQELIANFNRYKIELLELENNLLERLANAPEDILSDVPLIEGLEATKKASLEIADAVKLGKETEIQINLAREVYRPAATEASMIYFMLTDLNVVNYMYQYSLDAFTFFFFRAIDIAVAAEDSKERVMNLIKSLRFVLFQWVVRGLFEQDKLILMSQLTFKLLLSGKIGEEEVNFAFFNFLLRAPKKAGKENPTDWLPNAAWATVCALSDATNNSKQVLSECLLQSSPATPLFFILSPGVDVVADVDKCATEYNMVRFETYHNISMGQGQDPIAMSKLEVAHKQGHWVILNNIHLMP